MGVFLRIALRHQEAVIAATAARIVAADPWPRIIYGAAPLLGIEEAADLPKMGIGLSPHGIGLFAINFGKLLAGNLEAQAEMIGQPLYITLLERDQGIGAAIARTFRTIVGRHVVSV